MLLTFDPVGALFDGILIGTFWTVLLFTWVTVDHIIQKARRNKKNQL